MSRSKRGTTLASVEVINQRTNKDLMTLSPAAAIDFAFDYAKNRDADDIMFIGMDTSGHTVDSWTLSEVLAGQFSPSSRDKKQVAHEQRMKVWKRQQEEIKKRKERNAR